MQVLFKIMGNFELENNKNGYLDTHFYYFVVEYLSPLPNQNRSGPQHVPESDLRSSQSSSDPGRQLVFSHPVSRYM